MPRTLCGTRTRTLYPGFENSLPCRGLRFPNLAPSERRGPVPVHPQRSWNDAFLRFEAALPFELRRCSGTCPAQAAPTFAIPDPSPHTRGGVPSFVGRAFTSHRQTTGCSTPSQGHRSLRCRGTVGAPAPVLKIRTSCDVRKTEHRADVTHIEHHAANGKAR